MADGILSDGDTVSIRAYGAQEAFKAESYRRINEYTRAARTSHDLERYAPAYRPTSNEQY